MVDLVFQPEWWEQVKDGRKRQTIRPYRNFIYRVGMKVRGIKHRFKPRSRDNVLFESRLTFAEPRYWHEVAFDEETARLDGFKNSGELREWFHKRYGDIPSKSRWWVLRWG